MILRTYPVESPTELLWMPRTLSDERWNEPAITARFAAHVFRNGGIDTGADAPRLVAAASLPKLERTRTDHREVELDRPIELDDLRLRFKGDAINELHR